MCSNGRK